MLENKETISKINETKIINNFESLLNCKIEIPFEEFILNLNYLLSSFPSKESLVVKRRYIYNDTYENIGKEFLVTRERIRQFIAKIDRKIIQKNNETHLLDKGLDYYIKEKIAKGIKSFKSINKIDNTKENNYLDINVFDLDLSFRIQNCLNKNGIHTLYDLSQKTILEIRNIRGLGEKSFNELMEKAKEYGINFKQYKEEI